MRSKPHFHQAASKSMPQKELGWTMQHAEEKKIKITMDGPYEVTGNIPLDQAIIGVNEKGESATWNKGKTYQQEEGAYQLCRCGHSRTKPYCDGTHSDVEFCGRENADRLPYGKQAELRKGPGCSLLDDETLCVGARFCDKNGSVWRLVDASFIPENKVKAIEEACDCPSGRLTIVDTDGGHIEPQLSPEISLIEDPVNNCRGPLWVKGGILVEGANGEKYETRNRVTLCRCGESQNQPFCDGSHYNCEHMRGMDDNTAVQP